MKHKITRIGLAALLGLFPLLLVAQNESIFYKISHPETNAESYILGTFHTYPEGWYQIPQEVESAMSKTERLVVEIGKSTPKKYIRKIQRATRYKKGRTVIDELEGNSKERFKRYVNDSIGGTYSEKMAALNRKPFFMYGRLFSLRFSDQVMSMEKELGNLATDYNIPIIDLESNHRRILNYYRKYANAIPSANLDSLVELRIQSIAELFAQYLDGDINAMHIAYGEPDENVIERNEFWIPQLVDILQSASFVAIGTAHLMGEKAVQELLKQQGFVLEPIKLAHKRPEALNNFLKNLE